MIIGQNKSWRNLWYRTTPKQTVKTQFSNIYMSYIIRQHIGFNHKDKCVSEWPSCSWAIYNSIGLTLARVPLIKHDRYQHELKNAWYNNLEVNDESATMSWSNSVQKNLIKLGLTDVQQSEKYFCATNPPHFFLSQI